MMTASMFGELLNTLWWLFPVPVVIAIMTTPWFRDVSLRLLTKLSGQTRDVVADNKQEEGGC